MLLTFGAARTVWLGFVAFAPPGTGGLVVIIAADTLLLFCAGVFNPTFVTYRMRVTADTHMTRVATAWSVSSKTVQPACIAAAGLLAAVTSARTAIGVAAVAVAASTVLLPWRTSSDRADAGVTQPVAAGGAGDA